MTGQQCDNLIDYFNSHLPQHEKAQFEKHLKDCPQCQQELLDLRELEDYLPYAADPITPPIDLEDRVFAAILEDGETKKVVKSVPPKNKWLFPSVAALLAISLLGNAYFFTKLDNEPNIVVDQGQVDKVVKYVDLAPVEGNAKGTASIVRQGEATRLVVQASQLDELTEDEVYQVWLIEGDKPERAGTFKIEDGKGSVVFNFNEKYENVDWDTVAISQEPDANSQLPQGNIVLASEL